MQSYTPHVLITALTQTLDRNTQIQMLKSLTSKGIQQQSAMSQDMADKITVLTKQLEDMAASNKEVSASQLKAIEGGMYDVLKSLESKGLFSFIIPVNGKNYAIKDIATALANMPAIKEESPIYNEDKSGIVAVKFVLDNGTESIMTAVTTEDNSFRSDEFTGNFNNVPASYKLVYGKQVDPVDTNVVHYFLLSASNILFDITAGLQEASAFTAMDVAKDLDGDGTIGSVTKQPTASVQPAQTITSNDTVQPVQQQPAVDLSGDGAVL